MRRIAGIVVGLLLLCCGASAAPLTIVEDGKSDYPIVVPTKASPSLRRGATELQTYIEKMSGAKLPLTDDLAPLPQRAILVGDTRYSADLVKGVKLADLGAEGFVLKAAGPHVVVFGSDVRGAMYGCTALLEKLGARWYTAKVTFAPYHRTLSVPGEMDETQKPAFEYREAYISEAWDKDFSARMRLNGQAHRLDESTGGKVRYSHFVHTFDELIPRELYATHPEYFPLIKGSRQKPGYNQRCLSNPDVLKIATQRVLKWIADDPG
ncbi:MAG TPA: DUF4838 domain-containing protein, partial [Tepidisphaeraceae bacterium]